jgi:cytochrome c biogenesis protein CcmG, thiol:disulfide interchange protein DsbE
MRPFHLLVAIALLCGVAAAWLASRPTRAPEMHLTDLDGHSVDWERFAGKVVLVDFWATWCPPCRVSMPELQAVQERWEGQGFTVLGISVGDHGPAAVEKFVSDHDLTYPIAIDDPENPVASRFGVRALPTAFLVDRQGRIVRRWTGAADPEELDRRLGQLLDAER